LAAKQEKQNTIQKSADKASIYIFEQLDNPLSYKANFNWNADSGATSYITLHKYWLRNYKPLSISIKLANNAIIYSAGVGSILFRPLSVVKNHSPFFLLQFYMFLNFKTIFFLSYISQNTNNITYT
jgi:hypothetical protein